MICFYLSNGYLKYYYLRQEMNVKGTKEKATEPKEAPVDKDAVK